MDFGKHWKGIAALDTPMTALLAWIGELVSLVGKMVGLLRMSCVFVELVINHSAVCQLVPLYFTHTSAVIII